MRMIPLLAVVVALGLSMMVLAGLGVDEHYGSSGETGLQEEVENHSDQNESLSAEEGDDGGFFSFVVGAVGTMTDMFSIVLFLPATLRSLGLPPVVSRAVGHGAQLVITIGMVQIALQYNIR